MTLPAPTPGSPRSDPPDSHWRDVDFPLVQDDDAPDGLAQWIERLRHAYQNGSVLRRAFAIPAHANFNLLLRDGAFCQCLWDVPGVKAAIPHEVQAGVCLREGFAFNEIHAVALPGSLAGALVAGGAYRRSVASAREALAIASAAAEDLLAGDFDETRVYVSHQPWSSYFFDVAWDWTWIVLSPRRRRVDVVMATDTD